MYIIYIYIHIWIYIYIHIHVQWIGLRENLQETIDFPIEIDLTPKTCRSPHYSKMIRFKDWVDTFGNSRYMPCLVCHSCTGRALQALGGTIKTPVRVPRVYSRVKNCRVHPCRGPVGPSTAKQFDLKSVVPISGYICLKQVCPCQIFRFSFQQQSVFFCLTSHQTSTSHAPLKDILEEDEEEEDAEMMALKPKAKLRVEAHILGVSGWKCVPI